MDSANRISGLLWLALLATLVFDQTPLVLAQFGSLGSVGGGALSALREVVPDEIQDVATTFSEGLQAISLEDIDEDGPQKVILDGIQKLVDAAMDLNAELSIPFFPDIELRPSKTMTDSNGDTHYRLQQFYKDIRILNADIISRTFKAQTVQLRDRETGELTGNTKTIPESRSLSGLFFAGVADTLAGLDGIDTNGIVEEIKDTIISGLTDLVDDSWRLITGRERQELVLVIDPASALPIRLAVEIQAYGESADRGNAQRPYRLVDALTKEVLKEYDSLTAYGEMFGGNPKTGKIAYDGKQRDNITLTEDADGKCQYGNDEIGIVKLEKGQLLNDDELDKATTYSLNCSKIAEEITEFKGSYGLVNDAFFYAQRTMDKLRKWYNGAGLEGMPKIKIWLYGPEEDNAVWNGREVILYSGNKRMHPLVAADVVAHEIGHAISEFNSGLEYAGESGGINEAFSDFLGKTIDSQVLGGELDWEIGADILKAEGEALRYMNDPTLDKKSIKHYKDYKRGISVHHSSGVFNKAFYELAQQKTLTIPIIMDMFYTAQVYHWRSSTNFKKGAEGALAAMCELKQGKHFARDYDAVSTKDVIQGFKKVGIKCRIRSSKSCKTQCKKSR